MVGIQTAGKALAYAAGALLLSPAVAAQTSSSAPAAISSMPDTLQCTSIIREPDTELSEVFGEGKQIELPADYAGTATVAGNWLAVLTKAGATHCVDLSWIYAATNFELFDGRFMGFEWSGYEAGGYILIDLAFAGTDIEIGARPVFSPYKNEFAAVQLSDAGWGGLEGFAVWRVYASGITPVHVDTALPQLADWRIDQWEAGSCIKLSAVPYERLDGNWDNLKTVRRNHYIAEPRTGYKLIPGTSCLKPDNG